MARDWDETAPTGSEDPGTLDTIILQLKEDIGDFYIRQHFLPADKTDSTCGEHSPGRVSVLAVDNETNLESATYYSGGLEAATVEKAIAYNTDLNCVCYWNGTNWIPITPRLAANNYVGIPTTSYPYSGAAKVDLAIISPGAISMYDGEIAVIDVFGLLQSTAIGGILRVTVDDTIVQSPHDVSYNALNGGWQGFGFRRYFAATSSTDFDFEIEVYGQSAGAAGTVSYCGCTITIYPVIT